MKREATKTTTINNFLKTNNKIYGHIEYKHVNGKNWLSLLYGWQPHQQTNLRAAHKNGALIKLSDADPRLKVCDVVRTRPGEDSWLCIIFSKRALFIHVTDLEAFASAGDERIYEKDAISIARYTVNF